MRFYVYQPYNMPKGWYVTFDGYAVKKNKDGVWVYGTFAGPNLTPTNYIVGSVVPSLAGLSPWTQSAQVSSLVTVPDLSAQGKIAVSQPTGSQMPVAPQVDAAYSTWVPDWTFKTLSTSAATNGLALQVSVDPAPAAARATVVPLYVTSGESWTE